MVETMTMWVFRFRLASFLRKTTVALTVSNLLMVILGGLLVFLAFRGCDHHKTTEPVAVVSLAAAFRILATVQAGIAQGSAAKSILDDSPVRCSGGTTTTADSGGRVRRRVMYNKWLWWSRAGTVITLLQFVGSIYLVINVAKYFPDHETSSSECNSATVLNDNDWKKKILALFVFLGCSVPLVQFFSGPEVLRWRSFYATQDDAWRAHYEEVFDHGIRQALCCLGRVRYLSSVSDDEDEVFSVAKLLGDLVTYRASGTGHLELLAGLALLQRREELPNSRQDFMQQEAPKELIQEALALHDFAVAAYTGPLLDLGRHNVLFPCAWIYRQGILTPWMRSRRPVLAGDNWWRGHAAAFLKYLNLPPEVLRKGRVCQDKCQAAYFIVVLHHLRSVVIAVRGTETPEDLITDGLGRECILTSDDLDGLRNSSNSHPDVKYCVESSCPHYAHSGIVEAARDLFNQIDGNPGDKEPGSSSFLSSLLGAGCECDGYSIRIVGHSLGGAIASLLGMKLYGRYRDLRVYAYGPLPCVDSVIAEACSEFVTSIIHDNEFSARLSVGSVLRLRAAAIMALSQDSKADTALISRLAHRFLYVSKYQIGGGNKVDQSYAMRNESDVACSDGDIKADNIENAFYSKDASEKPLPDPVSQFLETVPTSENRSPGDPPELFLPGLVLHIVPQQRNTSLALWKGWRFQERAQGYIAYLANRKHFKDIIVSPNMFLDHLPWRCHVAMQKVLETHNVKGILDESQAV